MNVAKDLGGHVFVDESKQRDYLLVAAVVLPGVLARARRELRALVMPGQRRLHMKKESVARRSAIVEAIASFGATATVYSASRSGHHELEEREGCLRALVHDVVAAGHHLLVLEQDDSLLWWDRVSSRSPARRDAATLSGTSTVAPNTSHSWPFPTQSHGAGPEAVTGATAFSLL